MSYVCRLHPLIQQDFEEAYAWYEDKQKGLGERFLKTVRQKIEIIALQPEAHGSRGNTKFKEVKVEFFPYLIVYRIRKRSKEVYIVSIHHTKKNRAILHSIW